VLLVGICATLSLYPSIIITRFLGILCLVYINNPGMIAMMLLAAIVSKVSNFLMRFSRLIEGATTMAW